MGLTNPPIGDTGDYYLLKDEHDGWSSDAVEVSGSNGSIIPIIGCDQSGPFLFDVGFLYMGTNVPQGATIKRCTLFIQGVGTSVFGIFGAWWGYAVDVPTEFNSAHTHRISDHHTRTTATVTDNWVPSGVFESADLKSIVQEIVNRPGFVGHIGLTWRSAGIGDFTSFNEFSFPTPGDAPNATVMRLSYQRPVDLRPPGMPYRVYSVA